MTHALKLSKEKYCKDDVVDREEVRAKAESHGIKLSSNFLIKKPTKKQKDDPYIMVYNGKQKTGNALYEIPLGENEI